MERKLGEVFTYNGKTYQVVKSDMCMDCAFRENECSIIRSRIGLCTTSTRSDKTDVVFKEINNMEIKNNQLTIDIPEGMEIDLKNSDLAKGIVKFKKLEELKNTYKKLQEESNNLYSKIRTLERRNAISKLAIGDCYLDTKWNDLIKIVSIKYNYIYYICLSEACITRNISYIYNIENWKKITPHQFKDAYLATMKDIQNPDFEEELESNWNKVLNSIINSVNS